MDRRALLRAVRENVMKTLRIKVYGIVQGVGMRPVVARHAARTGIKGTVANLGPYVEIFAQGEAAKVDEFLRLIEEEPPAQPEIIYCKDCRKHNKKVGFDENFHTVWKEDACPLVSWRGKAQGHEFDYQFCAFADRRKERYDEI